MTEDQRVEMAWETPTLDEIVELTKLHVAAMESTDHEEVWQRVGMHHLLLYSVGRKSGIEHKVALPTWNDPEGNRIVVASYGGAPSNPAWFINLTDRSANPRVRCRVQGGVFWSDHQILAEGTERQELWDALCADRAWYAEYQEKTQRTIALVRLPESEPAA